MLLCFRARCHSCMGGLRQWRDVILVKRQGQVQLVCVVLLRALPVCCMQNLHIPCRKLCEVIFKRNIPEYKGFHKGYP